MPAKPITKADMENFAIKLTDDCVDHDAWLSVVRYGLGTLLENQPLFIEIIFREAVKQLERKKTQSLTISYEVRLIVDELGLRLIMNNN